MSKELTYSIYNEKRLVFLKTHKSTIYDYDYDEIEDALSKGYIKEDIRKADLNNLSEEGRNLVNTMNSNLMAVFEKRDMPFILKTKKILITNRKNEEEEIVIPIFPTLYNTKIISGINLYLFNCYIILLECKDGYFISSKDASLKNWKIEIQNIDKENRNVFTYFFSEAYILNKKTNQVDKIEKKETVYSLEKSFEKNKNIESFVNIRNNSISLKLSFGNYGIVIDELLKRLDVFSSNFNCKFVYYSGKYIKLFEHLNDYKNWNNYNRYSIKKPITHKKIYESLVDKSKVILTPPMERFSSVELFIGVLYRECFKAIYEGTNIRKYPFEIELITELTLNMISMKYDILIPSKLERDKIQLSQIYRKKLEDDPIYFFKHYSIAKDGYKVFLLKSE
jgi:hypothetical protein